MNHLAVDSRDDLGNYPTAIYKADVGVCVSSEKSTSRNLKFRKPEPRMSMGYGSGRVGLESGFLLRLYNTPPRDPTGKRTFWNEWVEVMHRLRRM